MSPRNMPPRNLRNLVLKNLVLKSWVHTGWVTTNPVPTKPTPLSRSMPRAAPSAPAQAGAWCRWSGRAAGWRRPRAASAHAGWRAAARRCPCPAALPALRALQLRAHRDVSLAGFGPHGGTALCNRVSAGERGPAADRANRLRQDASGRRHSQGTDRAEEYGMPLLRLPRAAQGNSKFL